MNVHLFFGSDAKKADIERRALETFAVARWAEQREKSKFSFTRDIVALGDFNMPKVAPTNPIFKALTSKGLHLPQQTSQIGSNLASDKHYDQIAFFPGATQADFTGNHGVFDFDAVVFPDLWQNRGQTDFNTYVKYYLSDHRPMWMELGTLEITRRAFVRRQLEAAWERVVALVVQPGVDFSDSSVHEYQRDLAEPLSRFIAHHPRLVCEAHSTDYQRPGSLRQLVEDHFAILKVGPALTFAFREAVFALAWMEQEWLGSRPDSILSDLPAVVDRRGEPHTVVFARRYSFSDRSRYYWTHPEVQAAVARLFENVGRDPPSLTLLSQCLPEQYNHMREGRLGRRPQEWVSDRITGVLRRYAWACGTGASALG